MAFIAGIALMLCGILCLWAFAGLIMPNFLIVAIHKMRVRKHAVGFPLTAAGMCFLISAAATAEAGWLAWAGLVVLVLLLYGYWLILRGFDPDAKQQPKHPDRPKEEAPKRHNGVFGEGPSAKHGRTRFDALDAMLPLQNRYGGSYGYTDETYDDEEELSEYTKSHTGYILNGVYEDEDMEDWYSDWQERLRCHLGRRPTEREDTAYIRLFGGDDQCRFNLAMFASRTNKGKVCLHALPNDYYRPRYETLVRTGAMLSGAIIPARERLSALNIEQLRRLAQEVGAGKAHSKKAIREMITEKGDQAIKDAWHVTSLNVSDLFLADPERIKRLAAN